MRHITPIFTSDLAFWLRETCLICINIWAQTLWAASRQSTCLINQISAKHISWLSELDQSEFRETVKDF
jgi:hypothetical protein